MISWVQKENACFAQCGVIKTDSEETINQRVPQDYAVEMVYNLLQKNLAARSYVCGKLIKRDIINNFLFDKDVHLGEDSLFLAMVCSEHMMDNCVMIPENMYYYFVSREGSLSKSGNVDDVMVCAEKWYVDGKKQKSGYSQKHFFQEGIKKLLSVRYWTMYRHDSKQYASRANIMMKNILRDLNKNGLMSTQEHIRYSIFVYFPIAYRMYRIITDHGMLGWEKEQKKKRKVGEI